MVTYLICMGHFLFFYFFPPCRNYKTQILKYTKILKLIPIGCPVSRKEKMRQLLVRFRYAIRETELNSDSEGDTFQKPHVFSFQRLTISCAIQLLVAQCTGDSSSRHSTSPTIIKYLMLQFECDLSFLMFCSFFQLGGSNFFLLDCLVLQSLPPH